MNKNKILEWLGSLCGIIGTTLLAFKIGPISEVFYIYAFSNIFFLWYAYRTKTWGIAVMSITYMFLSLIGIMRNK
jgi:hypothetical protein